MNNKEFKLDLIDKLLNRNVFTQRVSLNEIRTRCPYCGDSQKNYNTGHFYIKINPDDNKPIVYNCFKCPAQGILKYNDLELLNIYGDNYKENIELLNKSSDRFSYTESIENINFEYKIPDNFNNRYKIDYIENRLGLKFKDSDLLDLKVITSFNDFIKLNNLSINCKKGMFDMLEKQYIGFLSTNKAYILFRDITNKNNIRWYKYPISTLSYGQKIFYSISTELDIFSKDNVIINLSEGVMDCISIAYNLDNLKSNTLNMCVCGNNYITAIRYLIDIGLVGDNIIINIYSDNDGINATSLNTYNKVFNKIKILFKEVNIYYNLKSKDCGVRKEDIILKKYRL